MEHSDLEALLFSSGISLGRHQLDQVAAYVNLLDKAGKTQNLTGFRTKSDIIKNLIVDTIIPLTANNVPRGTRFVDVGTGQGIPGIIVAILYSNISGVLIDSNSRKIEFISHVVDAIKLNNVRPVWGRSEECSRKEEYREKFDTCFTRAFSPLYSSLEHASPFVKPGGVIFIYSDVDNASINQKILDHARRVALSPVRTSSEAGSAMGLVFEKISPIDDKYPRRNAIIKKESQRAEWSD